MHLTVKNTTEHCLALSSRAAVLSAYVSSLSGIGSGALLTCRHVSLSKELTDELKQFDSMLEFQRMMIVNKSACDES